MKRDLRKKIEDTLKSDVYVPMYPTDLYEYISGGDESLLRPFIKELSHMEEIGEISVNKKGKIVYCAKSKSSCSILLSGTFHSSSRGAFGFVTTDAGEFFIPPRFTLGAFDGDSVDIKRFTPSSKFYGKGNEAEIVSITKRRRESFIGKFSGFWSKGKLYGEVRSDDDKLALVGYVVGSDVTSVSDGDKVVCKIIKYPVFESDSLCVRITESLGASNSKEANYKAVLREHMIPTRFDDNVLDEAEKASRQEISTLSRLDLRKMTIFTIDSESAKDLDDAISIEFIDDGYVLGVHIADVSHYVREKTLLDKEAMARGTSVYFTDKVVPMLPPALSNGACSLNAGVDRYALSAFITLDKNGKIIGCKIENSVINSKMRGVYSELNDIIEHQENSRFFEKYRHIIPDFEKMLELYALLRDNSLSDGAMELESDEAEIVLDENGKPVDIIKRERGESERLIEQFMLCANKAIARFCFDRGIPCVYRVHEAPDDEKIRAFSLFASNIGIDTSSLRKKEISPLDLSAVLEDAKFKGKGDTVSSVLLRSLMKAKYSAVAKIHFGLATDRYCHFTSPIRRYPDLSVHRILKAYLNGFSEGDSKKFARFADRSAKESSENELRALYAERGIDDLYKAIYMSDRIGKEYDATISSVASFGIFAKTDKLCEGLIPISTLNGSFYFDESNFTLSSGKKVFRLGDKIRIRVIEADIVSRKVTFSLVGDDDEEHIPFNTPKIKAKRAHKDTKPTKNTSPKKRRAQKKRR